MEIKEPLHYYWHTKAKVIIKLRQRLPMSAGMNYTDVLQYVGRSYYGWNPKMLFWRDMTKLYGPKYPLILEFLNYGKKQYQKIRNSSITVEGIAKIQAEVLKNDRIFKKLRSKIIRLTNMPIKPPTLFRHVDNPEKRVLLINHYSALPRTYTECIAALEMINPDPEIHNGPVMSMYLPENNIYKIKNVA
jgi:hypothetical protein